MSLSPGGHSNDTVLIKQVLISHQSSETPSTGLKPEMYHACMDKILIKGTLLDSQGLPSTLGKAKSCSKGNVRVKDSTGD
jgi:hypothetical protein